jgi:hypothetical protein
MRKKIFAVVILIIGSLIAFSIPSDFAIASYRNSGYQTVVITTGLSVLLFYLADKIGKFKTTRPLGLAIFLPGIFNVFISLASNLLNDSAKQALKPGVLELSKYTLINAIILCVIGFLFFILRGVFKSNSPSVAPENFSSDKDFSTQVNEDTAAVCPVCSKNNTYLDYQNNSFCRNCMKITEVKEFS